MSIPTVNAPTVPVLIPTTSCSTRYFPASAAAANGSLLERIGACAVDLLAIIPRFIADLIQGLITCGANLFGRAEPVVVLTDDPALAFPVAEVVDATPVVAETPLAPLVIAPQPNAAMRLAGGLANTLGSVASLIRNHPYTTVAALSTVGLGILAWQFNETIATRVIDPIAAAAHEHPYVATGLGVVGAGSLLTAGLCFLPARAPKVAPAVQQKVTVEAVPAAVVTPVEVLAPVAPAVVVTK